jgi:hypothetical protein
MKRIPKNRQVIEPRVLSSLNGHGPGWVFSPAAFARLGDPRSVGMALTRLSRKGVIRQIARGLYEVPRNHPTLGAVPASTEAIAKALAGRHALRLQPAGAYAANALGLSEQVPVRAVFLTDGPSRKVKIGKRDIVLKRTTPRNMATAGRTSGMVIQALRWIGQKNVDEKVVARLRRALKPEDRAALIKDAHLAPAWIADIFRRLGEPS